jgi:hypothetical protein
VLSLKGMPITVARDSADYQKVMAKLESLNVGGSKGAADRALIADVLFAKTETAAPVPRFVTADAGVYKPLATESGIELSKLGGTLPKMKPAGFEVTIEGWKIWLIPVD